MKIEAFGWVLTLEKDGIVKKNKEAEWMRDQFRSGLIDKVPAIKKVREIYLDTDNPRGTLKGAKDFIES